MRSCSWRSDQFCGQINRLQRIMEKEKLLLKIRLLEKDLLPSPIKRFK